MVMIIRTHQLKFIFFVFFSVCLGIKVYPQSIASDSLIHPYHVNYYVTGTICGVGLLTNYLGIPQTLNKKEISLIEIQALNRSSISGIDYWALKQDPTQTDKYLTYSNYVLTVSVAIPVAVAVPVPVAVPVCARGARSQRAASRLIGTHRGL